MKVIWTKLALKRANEIADFIAAESVEAAQLWLIDAFGVVERLEEFPRSGRKVPEVNQDNLREIILKKYRIIYRIRAKRIYILTIWHSRQSPPLDEL